MNEKTEERPESRTQTAGTENKERKRTDPQRQAQKRTAVAALLMLIPFCAFMYLIFGDTDAGEGPGTGGINTTIPDGKVQRIEASRQKRWKPRRSPGIRYSLSERRYRFPNRTARYG